jgi:uncharacterized membrane protein
MADQQTKDKALEKAEPDFLSSIIDELPLDRLKSELQDALSAVAERAIDAAGDKVTDLTSRLTDVADGGSLLGGGVKGGMLAGAVKGGLSGVKDKAKEALTGGGGGGGSKPAKATKATNIVESIDVGVPIDVAYNQWTQFQDFPSFMKKVENVEQQAEEKVTWKAKIVWSHRTWESTILDQVPDDRIVWRSKGQKGHVDGAVTFHELAPNLTRILVVLEYYPQGMFERVGNIWRAQGRRARLELKHFRRHVMTRTILNPDDVEGWRGEIHDSQVTRGPDEEDETSDEYDENTDEYDQNTDEYDDDSGDDAEDNAEDDQDDVAEDEYDDSDEYDEEEPDDEEPDDEAEDGEPEDEYADDEYEDEGDEGDTDESDAEEDDEAYDEQDEYDEGEDDDADDEYDEYDDEDEDAYDDETDDAEQDDRQSRRRAS